MSAYTHFLKHILLPSISLCTESRFWPLYRTLSDPETIACPANMVYAKVARLLKHAHESVPLYRQRMNARGLDSSSFGALEDLDKLPLITKADIAANFPDGMTDSARSYRPWRYRSTSGTIERLTVVHDSRKRDAARAADLLSLWFTTGYEPGMKTLEIPPDVCRNTCGSSATQEPSLSSYFFTNLKAGRLSDAEVLSDLRGLTERQIILRKLVLNSYGNTGVAQPPEFFQAYIDSIRRYRPHVVKALPIYLYTLALHMIENGTTPPPITGGILPMGSSLSPHMKRIVETAFQVSVHEDYGCAELGMIGSECGCQEGIHPFSSLFYVEVVKDGRPAAPGELGKVVITDLMSYGMPFIRYEIGDVAVVRNGRCACGIEGPRLDLQGRLQDCLTAADGTVVSADTVTDAILSCPEVRLFQLEARTRNDLALKVVPMPNTEPDITTIRRRLSRLLGQDLRISHQFVRTILPEQGGKFRLVKNLAEVDL